MSEPRWVSQSEAARLETEAGRPVAQSNISRFLDTNPDVPVQRGPTGKVQLVDYEVLRAARASSLPVQDKLSLRETPPARLLLAAVQNATDRKRAADAESAELNLAQRKGALLSKDAATSAIEAAGVTFVQAMERRRRTLAQKIAGLPDFRVVELELKASDRALLEALASDLSSVAQEMTGATATT